MSRWAGSSLCLCSCTALPACLPASWVVGGGEEGASESSSKSADKAGEQECSLGPSGSPAWAPLAKGVAAAAEGPHTRRQQY